MILLITAHGTTDYLKPDFHFPFKRLRCVRCVNGNRKKRKRLRWQSANRGCHCFDRSFLFSSACVCCVKFSAPESVFCSAHPVYGHFSTKTLRHRCRSVSDISAPITEVVSLSTAAVTNSGRGGELKAVDVYVPLSLNCGICGF